MVQMMYLESLPIQKHSCMSSKQEWSQNQASFQMYLRCSRSLRRASPWCRKHHTVWTCPSCISADDQPTADMWAALTRETWRARLRGVQRNVEVSLTLLAVDGATRCQAHAPGQRRWAVSRAGAHCRHSWRRLRRCHSRRLVPLNTVLVCQYGSLQVVSAALCHRGYIHQRRCGRRC